MSALNAANIINTWVENRLNLRFRIQNDVMAETGDAVCLRYDPAPAAERRYNDGSRLLKWNLTYYVRNKNRATARSLADDLTAALDGAEITDRASGIKIDCEAQTLPQFISTDEKNNTVYSAAITCTYLEPR